jgi:tetratricopeptide (TPR) repeat protein
MSLPLAEAMIDAASLAIAGKKEDALAELCRARDAGHQSPKLYDAIGHLQFELRHFEEASATYDISLRMGRGDSLTYYNRAVCLEKMGAWGEAATEFRKAIDLDSRRASAYLGLGISQLHLGNPQEALAAFEKCLERQPFREAALRGQAVALHLLHRNQEASECYQRLLTRDPQSEELLVNAISLAITHGDYEWLAQCCGRLIEIQPASPVQPRRRAAENGAIREGGGCVRARGISRPAIARSVPQSGYRSAGDRTIAGGPRGL